MKANRKISTKQNKTKRIKRPVKIVESALTLDERANNCDNYAATRNSGEGWQS